MFTLWPTEMALDGRRPPGSSATSATSTAVVSCASAGTCKHANKSMSDFKDPPDLRSRRLLLSSLDLWFRLFLLSFLSSHSESQHERLAGRDRSHSRRDARGQEHLRLGRTRQEFLHRPGKSGLQDTRDDHQLGQQPQRCQGCHDLQGHRPWSRCTEDSDHHQTPHCLVHVPG